MPQNPKTEKDRKGAILAAAAKVFARKGYGSTRIGDVAREAKLSYGLAYYYFSSRDRLFHLVVQRALDATLSLYHAAQRLKGSHAARLRALTETLLTTRLSEAGMQDTLVMVQAITHAAVPKVTRVLVDDRMMELDDILTKLIRGAQAEGHAVVKDPVALATTLNAMIAGFSVMRVRSPGAPMPDLDTFLPFLS